MLVHRFILASGCHCCDNNQQLFSSYIESEALPVALQPFAPSNSTMEPTIEKVVFHLVSLWENYVWKVSAKDVAGTGDTLFLKLSPWAHGFVRLVTDGVVEIDLKSKPAPSLRDSEGIAVLVKLRNAAQAEALKPKCTLFDSPSVAKVKLPKRAAVSKCSDSISVKVPSFDYLDIHYDERLINMLRPLRSDDPLCVEMEAHAIAHVVAFIRHMGISVDTLRTKRPNHKLSYEERMKPKWQRYREKPAEEEEGDEESGNDGEPEDNNDGDGVGEASWWGP